MSTTIESKDNTVPTEIYHNVQIDTDRASNHPQELPCKILIAATSQIRPSTINNGPNENGSSPIFATILLHGPGSGGPKYFPVKSTWVPSKIIQAPFSVAKTKNTIFGIIKLIFFLILS